MIDVRRKLVTERSVQRQTNLTRATAFALLLMFTLPACAHLTSKATIQTEFDAMGGLLTNVMEQSIDLSKLIPCH
jgi:hypothetical protein